MQLKQFKSVQSSQSGVQQWAAVSGDGAINQTKQDYYQSPVSCALVPSSLLRWIEYCANSCH